MFRMIKARLTVRCHWPRGAVAMLAVGSLPVLAETALAQNLLQNGSFSSFVPTNSTINVWNSQNLVGAFNQTGWISFAGGGNPSPGFWLAGAGTSADPRVYQTVVGLVVGEEYVISGEYGLGTGNGSAANSFEVRVDGTPILQLGPHSDHDPAAGTLTPFMPFLVAFTATATSHVIEFAAECNGSDHDYAVDNLSLTLSTTLPVEASTWGKVKALYR